MDEDNHDFIYGIVEEFRKSVLANIIKKELNKRGIPFVTSCNFDAIFRLLKV